MISQWDHLNPNSKFFKSQATGKRFFQKPGKSDNITVSKTQLQELVEQALQQREKAKKVMLLLSCNLHLILTFAIYVIVEEL